MVPDFVRAIEVTVVRGDDESCFAVQRVTKYFLLEPPLGARRIW